MNSARLTRRHLLKTAMAGAAGALLGAPVRRLAAAAQAGEISSSSMKALVVFAFFIDWMILPGMEPI